MRITVLGASGFIGRHLTAALRARGDQVVGASLRDPVAAARASAGSDVVVNLAGATVATRWTAAAKRAIEESRIALPRAYIDAMRELTPRPHAYVSASAVGYYGMSRSAAFTERDPAGVDFLARVCALWEQTALAAGELGMRVACVRTGLVLAADGGALAPLLPVFRLGLGGRVGDGGQWYSWIHMADQVGIYLHAIDGAEGPLNATAPNPVTNREFTAALARTLRRPALLPVPRAALGLMLGEGASIVTEGQRVLPERTVNTGYQFRFERIEHALADVLH